MPFDILLDLGLEPYTFCFAFACGATFYAVVLLIIDA